jgi:hypothetical protein
MGRGLYLCCAWMYRRHNALDAMLGPRVEGIFILAVGQLLAQLAQLGAGFSYFRGFCIA